ncbi:MAG: flagellar basal body L-ring protein FlgH [Polyangia bacterium]
MMGAAPSRRAGHLWAMLWVAVAAGCGPAHLGEYTPKHRDYKPPAEGKGDDEPASPGSLWREGRPASMLFTDARALHTNDLVVINVEEVANASRSADTNLARSSSSSAGITAFLGLLKKLKISSSDSGLNIGGNSTSTFTGQGSSDRSESLTATVPAVVIKVLANGNLFVEGHRAILVNAEEHHFYISGVVRPIDIDQQNSVKSSMVADAQIEFTGHGDLTDNQRQGWLSRYLGWIWPF